MFTPEFVNQLKTSFGKLSNAVRLDGRRCFLLKRDTHSAGWVILAELTVDYTIRYVKDTFRKVIIFHSFSNTEGFGDLFAQATFIAWGNPDAQNEVDLYEIDPQQKDDTEPDGLSPVLRAVANRFPEERFEVE